jgi:hypothetical protein
MEKTRTAGALARVAMKYGQLQQRPHDDTTEATQQHTAMKPEKMGAIPQ